MELNKINTILENLDYITGNKLLKKISEDKSLNYYEEKNQGDEGISVEIYKIEGEDEIFLKITKNTDSYGGNERTSSIKFVTAKEKTITIFEPIN